MMENCYSVQILVVQELAVTAQDELQAERLAYRGLNPVDAGAAIAIRVLNRDQRQASDGLQLPDEDVPDGGALASESNVDNWKVARDCFDALDRAWCE